MIGIGRIGTWRAVGVVAMAASLTAGPAMGWGRLGHRVAGRIAEDRLTPAARAAVRGLLAPGESLADISTWADDYRRDHRETGPWHYVNVPIAEPKFDAKFIPPEGCVVTKIDDFRKILADPNAPREGRVQALKFLTHFVQDMHQPLHVGHRDDRGGNNMQVQFFDKGSNLHAVWDSGLLERAGRDEPTYVGFLSGTITPELAGAWSSGTTVDWADESLGLARKAYRDPTTGAEMKSGARLGQPYQDASLPLAEKRVAQAGVRLAWILNDIFK
jgi:nuclease S1